MWVREDLSLVQVTLLALYDYLSNTHTLHRRPRHRMDQGTPYANYKRGIRLLLCILAMVHTQLSR